MEQKMMEGGGGERRTKLCFNVFFARGEGLCIQRRIGI